MKKFFPAVLCLFSFFIMIFVTMGYSDKTYINVYPNLPAPIGKEKILITSAGQTPEGRLMHAMAEELNLQADYRPRALASDLYDYQTVVIVVGFSANGLTHTNRCFEEELERVKELVGEAALKQMPLIIVHLAGHYRENKETLRFFETIVPYAHYFIGLKNMKQFETVKDLLHTNQVPATFVSHIRDMKIPFNSVFR